MYLFLGDHHLSFKDSEDFEIKAATKVYYIFTKQKDTEEGIVITYVQIGYCLYCLAFGHHSESHDTLQGVLAV